MSSLGREPQENGRVSTQAPKGRQSGLGHDLCRPSVAQLALFPRILGLTPQATHCRPSGTCVDTNAFGERDVLYAAEKLSNRRRH